MHLQFLRQRCKKTSIFDFSLVYQILKSTARCNPTRIGFKENIQIFRTPDAHTKFYIVFLTQTQFLQSVQLSKMEIWPFLQ